MFRTFSTVRYFLFFVLLLNASSFIQWYVSWSATFIWIWIGYQCPLQSNSPTLWTGYLYSTNSIWWHIVHATRVIMIYIKLLYFLRYLCQARKVCVGGVDCVSFYDLDISFLKCSDSVVYFSAFYYCDKIIKRDIKMTLTIMNIGHHWLNNFQFDNFVIRYWH